LSSNDTERFRGWQEKSAMGHWAVMRTVLPEKIWEDWRAVFERADKGGWVV
jgi:hypothetical protein